ncbi:MAG: HesB/IscA family protein [Gammaproteobacteria bacterium]
MNHPITLTPSAVHHFKNLLEKKEAKPLGILLGVRQSGCSGWAYVIDFFHEESPEHVYIIQDQLQIGVTKTSLPVLEGTEVDYAGDELSMQLLFNNPRVEHTCGCGESFTVKPIESVSGR